MKLAMTLLEKGVVDIASGSADYSDLSIATAAPRVGHIMLLGDVALARRVGEQIDRHGVAYPFARLPSTYFDADIVVFNLECCLSARGSSWEPKPTVMRGKPGYLDVFPRQQQRYVANVANNHFLDFGEEGAMDTLAAITAEGMLHIGAEGELASYQPLVLQTAGGSVALLAFPPCAHRLKGNVRVNVTSERVEDIVRAVKQAKSSADVLIVSLHQGIEHCRYTYRKSRRLAQSVVAAGADLVVVHHAHVIQGIEQINGSLIFHGIGNFLLDIPEARRPAAANTLVVRVDIAGGKVSRIATEPVGLNEEWQPAVIDGPQRERIFAEIRRLSLLLGSRTGIAINDMAAWKYWFAHKCSGSLSMVRRVGFRKTISYYLGRAAYMLLRRSARMGRFG